jgi:hypothetical protein
MKRTLPLTTALLCGSTLVSTVAANATGILPQRSADEADGITGIYISAGIALLIVAFVLWIVARERKRSKAAAPVNPTCTVPKKAKRPPVEPLEGRTHIG